MALNERNFYCFCGIWVYMIIVVAASPAIRRAIIVNQSDSSANVTQNSSVCWVGNVAYNNEDAVPGSGPCEQCVCNVPDIVCFAVKCEMKTGCKIIQKEDQCCPDFKCDCEYNNRTYYNGEKIDTTDTPCRVCYCKGGDVMCSTVGCYERDDCEGKMVPGTCCPKYDHCPPLDENNKNVKITQIKTDTMTPRAGSRGLQPWPLSSDNVTVHPSIVTGGSTSRLELTIIMQRINPNPALSNETNITSEPVDSATFQDAAQEALNTIRVATQPATPSADANQDQESTRAEPDLPANGSRCAHITPAAHSNLVSAIFANTEITEKAPVASSTPTSDSIKPLVDMEKSTMAILQQLLDVKTTIEPLTAETNEALVAETIEPISAATIEQIAAKIAESIATTIEPADIFTQTHDGSHLSLLNLLGNDLTVRASVLQSENASRHATIDEDVEIANVSLVEKQSKSAASDTATEAATENAIVKLVEKVDNGLAHVAVPESSNGTVEAVVTATANVTVVDDPVNGTSTTASPTTPTNASDVTEVAQVVLVERNSSPATAWEDLGTALAHVTVSYKEENKVDSDLNSSPFQDMATEATASRPNSSEALSTTSDKVTNATSVHEAIDGDEKGGQIVESIGAAELAAETAGVTLSATSTAVITTSDEHTELNALVFNFSQPDGTETTSLASGLIQTSDSNGIRSNTIEFTTIQADISGQDSEEANSSLAWSSSTESVPTTVPSRLEIGAAATYTTDNGYNLTTQVEKVEQESMSANRSAAIEQLPLETTVASAIKGEGDANSSTELPTSTSASSVVRTDIPSTEVTRTGEFTANDSTPSNYVESVTFNNQIRLDVADQLPQSFFVESFLSPLNYSAPPSDTYPPNNDFPFEIFFNTNYSDSTSTPNLSVPANVSHLNVSTNEASADNTSDSSNYTKIFAQKIVVHPVKVLNSVNSVYLSPGLGVRDGSPPNSTESATKADHSTDTWSTEGYELTTLVDTPDHLWRNVSLSNYKILLDSLTDAKVRPFTKIPKVTGAPLTWLKNPFFGSVANFSYPNHSANATTPLKNPFSGSVANFSHPNHSANATTPLKNPFSGSIANFSHLNHSANATTPLKNPFSGSVANFSHPNHSVNATTPSNTTADAHLKNESRSEPQAKVYDPLMPYPEEYPEEYQTIQNGPAIIITRTTYTRIPDVTYTTVTMATLPTYQQVQKAEDGFAQTLFERKFRERSFAKENSESAGSTESTKYFNIDVKKIDDGLPPKRDVSKKSNDRRMPDPPLDNRNYIKSRISVKSVERADSKIPALDEKDLKMVHNFMNKHLRLR